MIDLAKYLPHKTPMILIDSLVEITAESVVVKVVVRNDYPFIQDTNTTTIGAWLGIEFIAQAAALLSGFTQMNHDETINPGFLLGTRKYISHVPYFNQGDELLISVQRDFQSEEGLAAVTGVISDKQGTKLCEAIVTLFQPKHPNDLLKH